MAKAQYNTTIKNVIAGKMTAEKKKAAIALALILVMAALWIKNIVKKDSIQDAQALAMAQQQSDVPKEVSFSYVLLPKIEGRHDALTKDIFVPNKWKGFRREGDMGNDWTAQTLVGGDEGSSGIERVVKEMELGAIVTGTERRAFIEGKMLGVGQEFTFNYKRQAYEFKIIEIYDNKVELQCNGAIVVKKIRQSQPDDDQIELE